MAEDLLLQAESLAQDFCRQLDHLLQQARQQQQSLETQARQLRRFREEVDMRLQLAMGAGAPKRLHPERLQVEQQEAIRQEQHALAALSEAEESRRRLELLLRQVEMSGRSLVDGAARQPYDPWELALRSQVLYGREQERAALAREVHDGPAQVLANSVLGLERCRQSDTLDDVHPLSESVLRDVRVGLQEVRRFIYDLRPSPLADGPLSQQVQRYTQDFATAYQSTIELRWAEAPRAFSPEECIAVYRILQEVLQNARKHARADRIIVETYVELSDWVLRVSDNGVGFDPTAVALQEDHWGMRGMRERAQLIGAELLIESRPNEGTTVVLRLPLRPKAEKGL
jgi:two-component system sensor histidine kinase DegS